MTIIDVHAHWGAWPFSMEVGDAAVNDELCERYGIDLQFVSASEAVIVDPVRGNAALDRVLVDHPRLRGLVVIDPNDLAATGRDLERYIHPGSRWVGAKLHEDYTQTPVGSSRAREALKLVAQAGVPILVHTWDHSVLDLADACVAIDGLTAIAGHMGGSGWRLAPEAASRTDRIFLEPSYSIATRGRYAWVAERVATEQLLFGTDATLIDPAVALGAVLAAGLDSDTLDAVMWRNAARVFDIDVSALQTQQSRGDGTAPKGDMA